MFLSTNYIKFLKYQNNGFVWHLTSSLLKKKSLPLYDSLYTMDIVSNLTGGCSRVSGPLLRLFRCALINFSLHIDEYGGNTVGDIFNGIALFFKGKNTIFEYIADMHWVSFVSMIVTDFLVPTGHQAISNHPINSQLPIDTNWFWYHISADIYCNGDTSKPMSLPSLFYYQKVLVEYYSFACQLTSIKNQIIKLGNMFIFTPPSHMLHNIHLVSGWPFIDCVWRPPRVTPSQCLAARRCEVPRPTWPQESISQKYFFSKYDLRKMSASLFDLGGNSFSQIN